MGKIIGIGGGCDEMPEVMKYIFSLAEKEHPSFLFLPTAQRDCYDENDSIFSIFKGFGCTVEVLLLTDKTLNEEAVRAKILSADIIYADGGNLRFMMNTFRATGADKALKEAFERGKVLSGVSSGMMCWFAEGYDDCDDGEFAFVDCIGLLPYVTCPHFESGDWPEFEKAVVGRKFSGIAAENGAAYVYVDGKTQIMTGECGGSVYFFNKENGFEKELLGGRVRTDDNI